MKSYQNILQNAPNCFIFLNFLVGACVCMLSYEHHYFYITTITFYTTFYQNIHHNADHVFNILSGSLNTPYIACVHVKSLVFI